jgi:hypothetical protein
MARDKLAAFLVSRALRNYRDFAATFKNPNGAQMIARWFFKLNRLKEFKLTVEINGTSKKRINKMLWRAPKV